MGHILNKRWEVLQSKTRLRKIFKNRPLIAYRRPKSLKDLLVSARFKSSEEQQYHSTQYYCRPCEKSRCFWCSIINITDCFISEKDGQRYKLLHNLNCQSSWVIYLITCRKCKKQYVGKSETPLNIRLNNHKSHIKNKINSCELAEHFIDNEEDHNFIKDTTILPIETIKKEHMDIDRKKQLLRKRERFWMLKLKSCQPFGLNKRLG